MNFNHYINTHEKSFGWSQSCLRGFSCRYLQDVLLLLIAHYPKLAPRVVFAIVSGKVEAGPVFKSFWHSQDLRSSRNACLHGAGCYTTFCRDMSRALLLHKEINPWNNTAVMILLLSWYTCQFIWVLAHT